MSRDLDALNRIIETFYDKETEDILLVKSALERKDKLEKLYKTELQNTSHYNNRCVKLERAISIIKTKRVDIAHLQDSKDCAEYNEVVKKLATLWRVLPLTEEEYEFLKEVLKHE